MSLLKSVHLLAFRPSFAFHDAPITISRTFFAFLVHSWEREADLIVYVGPPPNEWTSKFSDVFSQFCLREKCRHTTRNQEPVRPTKRQLQANCSLKDMLWRDQANSTQQRIDSSSPLPIPSPVFPSWLFLSTELLQFVHFMLYSCDFIGWKAIWVLLGDFRLPRCRPKNVEFSLSAQRILFQFI
jgi:hypothetical protein